jgi:predicted transcriptional regulator
VLPCQADIDLVTNFGYLMPMNAFMSIKMDPRMKAALEKLAKEQFISASAIVKQAVDKHLQEQGIDWRKEKIKDK